MEVGADAAKAYRKRAAELREKAAQMKDLESRMLMLSVAKGYEYLAAMIEGSKPLMGTVATLALGKKGKPAASPDRNDSVERHVPFFMDARIEELRRRIAFYRGFLEDGVSLHKTEFYLLQICESEDELAQLELNRRKLH
jgi:hypothetical protein